MAAYARRDASLAAPEPGTQDIPPPGPSSQCTRLSPGQVTRSGTTHTTATTGGPT